MPLSLSLGIKTRLRPMNDNGVPYDRKPKEEYLFRMNSIGKIYRIRKPETLHVLLDLLTTGFEIRDEREGCGFLNTTLTDVAFSLTPPQHK